VRSRPDAGAIGVTGIDVIGLILFGPAMAGSGGLASVVTRRRRRLA
jgi:hypothetical protein